MFPVSGDAGNELDAFWAAKFLEENDQTLTSISRKQAMKESDADNNGKMALIEYLTYKYQKVCCRVNNQNSNLPRGFHKL